MNGAARAFRDLPRSWSPPDTQRRFADVGSYDADQRTVEAILSAGAPVQRVYGTELLAISPAAVDLKRVSTGLVPILDSHQIVGIGNVLGRLEKAWFKSGQLVGLLAFDNSDAGREAEGLVSRGTVRGVSIGYRVDTWEVKDDEGNVVDTDRERLMWDAEYIFTAMRWELLEVSLVSVPADSSATIRSRAFGGSSIGEENGVAQVLQRMRARQRAALTVSTGVTLHRRRIYPGSFWRSG
jgi:phage head maturation protease